MSSLVFPILPFLLQICVVVYSLYVLGMLTSVGKPVYKVSNMDSNCPCSSHYAKGNSCVPEEFNKLCSDPRCAGFACLQTAMEVPTIVTYFKLTNYVGFFWLLFFVSAFSEMVIGLKRKLQIINLTVSFAGFCWRILNMVLDQKPRQAAIFLFDRINVSNRPFPSRDFGLWKFDYYDLPHNPARLGVH